MKSGKWEDDVAPFITLGEQFMRENIKLVFCKKKMQALET